MESITVVIPAFNAARYLHETIDSVLSQTVSVEQILVVDDGSTDGTRQIVEKYDSVQYLHQPNQGAAAARNLGVKHATGEVLGFLDSDDIWHLEKLERQLTVLKSNPNVSLVFCLLSEFICPQSGILVSELADLRIAVPAFVPSGLLVRRQVFEAVGEFDPSYDVGEFIDWYARCIDTDMNSSTVPEVLVQRRIHAANQGVTKRNSYRRDYLRILKKTLDRRRKNT